MEKALWVVGIVSSISGIVLLVAGWFLSHSWGSIEDFKKNVNDVLDQYEDEETLSDGDKDKIGVYIDKPLKKIMLGNSLSIVGIVLETIGGIMLIISR